MFMPIEFKNIFDRIQDEYSPVGKYSPYEDEYEDLFVDNLNIPEWEEYEHITEDKWKPYWENIVGVCAAIAKEPQHFDMDGWHDRCGTTHCLGGWAQFLYHPKEYAQLIGWFNKPIGYLPQEVSVFKCATKSMSYVMAPFYHVYGMDELVMEHLILAVVEEAQKDGTLPVPVGEVAQG